ncbi:hypothetical protein A2W24_01585 [Microgenomates group bacterium RBG_16_45_19]|nr:MAG: hypothetical protein A2W24_01585 [Microgenomates group bacterium RBG_16_45_19]
MSKNNNSPLEWDEILTNENYLMERGGIVDIRIAQAKKWWNYRKKVVNIGSGQGFLEDIFRSEILKNEVNWTAVDVSVKGLKRIKRIHDKVRIQIGNITHLQFLPNQFDLIYCMEVLEHLNKKSVALAYKELNRIATPKAIYVISVPVYEPRSLKNHPVGHNRKYTPEIVKDELEENGFKIIESKYFYAFRKLNSIKTIICLNYHLRRPNVVMFLCQKS